MTAGATSSWYRSSATWQFIFLLVTLAAASLSIAISQIGLGLVLLVFLYRGVVRRQWPARTGVELPAAALAVWALGMIPLAADVGQAAVYYRRFFLFAALWGAASLATNERRRGWLLGAVVAGALIASVVGGIQLAQQTGGLFNRRFLGSFNPMTSGALLMLVVLPALAFLVRRGVPRWWRVALAVASLPVALALVQTMTRSALLGLVAGVGAMVLLARPRLFLIFLLVLTILLGALYVGGEAVVPDRLWRRINPEYVLAGGNTQVRLEMWRGGWEMVKAHPWTGVGDCDLTALAPEYYGDEDTTYFGHLHSNPVMLAVIWGVPGFILAQIFIFAPLVVLVRRWRQPGDGLRRCPMQANWILGAVGIWAGFLVAGFTEWYFGDAEPMLLYLAILGIALGTGCPEIEQPKEQQ